MKKFAHPANRTLEFHPQYHQYKVTGLNQPFRSVSKVLNQYFPFDTNRIAAIVAEKEGKTVQDVTAAWKRQGMLGTNVHAFIEAKIEQRPPPMLLPASRHGDEELFFVEAEKAVQSVLHEYETIRIETGVASIPLGVAGTIDYLGRHKATGRFLIADWKTSGKAGTGFRFGSFEEPCPGILSHLPNEKFFRYALQILLYGYILRTEGYSKIFGEGMAKLPLEYGVIQFGKTEQNTVAVEFKEVTPATILPVDGDMTTDELLYRVLTEQW